MRARPRTASHRLASGLKKRARRFLTDAGNVGEFEDLSEHEKMLADLGRATSSSTSARARASWPCSRRAAPGRSTPSTTVIEVARHIAREHGVTNIEFVRTNSRKFAPPEKVDVILHEQIGDELFDENMVQNVSDLRDRILKPGGRIVPDKFEFYLEPVKLKDPFSVPFAWQMKLHGIDFGCIRSLEQGAGGLPRRWDIRWMNPLEADFLLCEPAPIRRLDLSAARVEELPSALDVTKRVVRAGRMDGLMMYVKGASTKPSTSTRRRARSRPPGVTACSASRCATISWATRSASPSGCRTSGS